VVIPNASEQVGEPSTGGCVVHRGVATQTSKYNAPVHPTLAETACATRPCAALRWRLRGHGFPVAGVGQRDHRWYTAALHQWRVVELGERSALAARDLRDHSVIARRGRSGIQRPALVPVQLMTAPRRGSRGEHQRRERAQWVHVRQEGQRRHPRFRKARPSSREPRWLGFAAGTGLPHGGDVLRYGAP
jgi:hypothetical protein